MEVEPFCETLADNISCASMIRLAKKEAVRNAQNLNFIVNSPACRFNSMREDKAKELELFAGNGITRKLCFDPESYVLDGPWKDQLTYIRPVPAVFISNTRTKTRTRTNDITKYEHDINYNYTHVQN